MEADTVAGLHTHDNFFTHEFAGGTNYYSDEESDGSDDPRLLDPRYLDMKANMKVDFNLVAPTVAHQQPSQACGLGGLDRRASAAPRASASNQVPICKLEDGLLWENLYETEGECGKAVAAKVALLTNSAAEPAQSSPKG